MTASPDSSPKKQILHRQKTSINIAKILFTLFFLTNSPCLTAQESDQKIIEITSKDGKSFLGEVIKVDEESANVKRASDGKSFRIPLEALDQKTRKALGDWVKKNRVLPMQKVNVETLEGKATLQVPEGKINLPHGLWGTAEIKYNVGSIKLTFYQKGAKDFLKKWLPNAVPNRLGRLTPDERERVEKTARIEKRDTGEWSTYRLMGVPSIDEFSSMRVRFSNGRKFGHIDVDKNINGTELSVEDVYRIIATVRVSK